MDSSGDREKEEAGASSLPEGRLTTAIVCTAIVSKVMNGLGTLATIWATVVLLGGFSVLIKQKDFWYVTIVAFVESIGILGSYEDPTQQIFLRAPEVLIKSKHAAKMERTISWWRRRRRRIDQEHHQSGGERRNRLQLQVVKQDSDQGLDFPTFLGFAIFGALRLAQIAAVTTCIVLSCRRLKKQDYVDPQEQKSEDHRNIRWSLNIFYGLVLAQGIIFIVLQNPLIWALTECTRDKYKLYMPSGRKVVQRYWSDNYVGFIAGNWRATLNMDLITFSKQLALSDIDMDDQLVGIRAMDRILRSVEYSSPALRKLRASLDADTLGKLIDMLGLAGTPDERDMRGHASRVLVKLAPDILLDTFPQAMYLISSSLLYTTGSNMDMDMDLVWFGLRILDKLTNIPKNCRHAKDLVDILPKIIDLTNINLRSCYGSRRIISDSWIEQEIIPLLQREDDIPHISIQKIDQQIIVGMSLNILSKLVATPGDAGKKLRAEASSNIHFLSDTGIILEHVGAARVIACLALDEQQKKEFARSPEIIKKLKECLLSKAAHADIMKVAAKLLLLEYTNSEQLSQIKSSIQEKNITLREDQSLSVPTTAFIEALDLNQLLPPWMQKQTAMRTLDLEDVLSVERVNHCEAAAKALAVLTSGCEENVMAVLQDITVQEMQMIVEMLFPEDREENRRRMLARLHPETLRVVKKIICTAEDDREQTRSVNAKFLQNLRAHGGTEKFSNHMYIIDQALPKVLKAVVDQVAKLEQAGSTNENLVNNHGLWVEAGKVVESFIGLAVQICYSLDASGLTKALVVANLTVDTFVLKLKKILELYKYPTTDFPSVRRATLELMNWMVGTNSKYRETILQCGVYVQLKEVAKTATKLESFQLFNCDVGVARVGNEHTSSIYSLVSNLQAQLELCPNFQERSHYYEEDASTITVLLA